MQQTKVSVVIAALNEGENLVDTVRCIVQNSHYPQFEVIVVDDGSVDGSGWRVRSEFHDCSDVTVLQSERLGVARARNHGAAAASGDVLIFMDGHCYTPPGWLAALISPLEDPRVGMVGPAIASLGEVDGPRGYGAIWRSSSLDIDWLPCKGDAAYEVPLHPGGCQAVRSSDFQALGGYDVGMGRWGSEGEELTLRYWLMGYDVVVQPRAVLHHLFRKRHPYQVHPPQVIYNRLRMGTMHFGPERLGTLFSRLATTAEFARIVQWLFESDVTERREHYQRTRQRDDDWFFARFPDADYRPVQGEDPYPRASSLSSGVDAHVHAVSSVASLLQRNSVS